MRIHRSIISCFVFLTLVDRGIAEEKTDFATKYPVLAILAPPVEKLPVNCKVLKTPPSGVPEFKGLKNRAITVDSRHFLIAGGSKMEMLVDINTIEAAFFSVYREEDEIGVAGWAFKDAETAKNTHQSVMKGYARQKDLCRFWQVDRYVVWLWRDSDTTDECFEFFELYLTTQLVKANAAGG